MSTLILFNKPYGVLSQFTQDKSNDKSGEKDKPTLAQYIKLPNVYPAGRLDHDSEGLLLLTDDGQLQHHIAHPAHKLPKTYWVQVEGAPNSYALTKLRQGVELNDGITQPAEARLIPTPKLWERDPPIRSRQNIPTQWLEIVISEGKNRQVRRMTAAVGHPTLRLVRVKIGNWTLEGVAPGEYKATTVNLPKSALAELPRGRGPRPARNGTDRPARNTAGRPAGNGERNTNLANTPKNTGEPRPARANPTSNTNGKPKSRPQQPRTGANQPATKPSVTTKVIIKPSRPKLPSE